MNRDRKTFPVAVLFGIRKILGWATLALIIVLLAPKLFIYFDNPKGFAFSAALFEGRDVVLKFCGPIIRKFMPTAIAGSDRTDWILLIIAFVITTIAGSFAERAQTASNRKLLQKSADAYRRSQHIQPGSRLDTELQTKLLAAQRTKSGNRQDLLKVFAETKKQLDKFGREVAFLSIDVVGSTAMKIGEDPASVEYDYREYRKMVEQVFRTHAVLKQAWTPDGVMACFAHVEDAVRAGKEVIKNLKIFNQEIKLTKTDFAVRCGVNSGLVYFEDATPLESISDRVIDVAGHMQKYAEPNTVAIPRKIVEPLRDRHEFIATEKVIDGYEVSTWRSAP